MQNAYLKNQELAVLPTMIFQKYRTPQCRHFEVFQKIESTLTIVHVTDTDNGVFPGSPVPVRHALVLS